MTLQDKLKEIAKKVSSITTEAVVVAPSQRRERSIGLSKEDCDSFDKYFNLPVGYGWAKLQKIRLHTPADFDMEKNNDTIL